MTGRKQVGGRFGYTKYELGPKQGVFIGESSADIETIIEIANERAHRFQDHMLADKEKNWRKGPASDQQLALLKKLGVDTSKHFSKDQAARVITFKMALQYCRQKGVM